MAWLRGAASQVALLRPSVYQRTASPRFRGVEADHSQQRHDGSHAVHVAALPEHAQSGPRVGGGGLDLTGQVAKHPRAVPALSHRAGMVVLAGPQGRADQRQPGPVFAGVLPVPPQGGRQLDRTRIRDARQVPKCTLVVQVIGAEQGDGSSRVRPVEVGSQLPGPADQMSRVPAQYAGDEGVIGIGQVAPHALDGLQHAEPGNRSLLVHAHQAAGRELLKAFKHVRVLMDRLDQVQRPGRPKYRQLPEQGRGSPAWKQSQAPIHRARDAGLPVHSASGRPLGQTLPDWRSWASTSLADHAAASSMASGKPSSRAQMPSITAASARGSAGAERPAREATVLNIVLAASGSSVRSGGSARRRRRAHAAR